MTSASSMHEAGDSKPVLWDNPRALCLGSRDGVGEKVGGGFRMGGHMCTVADSCRCMAKTPTIL